MKKEYYVYVYLDPRKQGKFIYNSLKFLHEPIYIGKGKGKRHIQLKDRNSFITAKLAKIDNKPIILIIADNLKESEAFDLEKELITLIGRRDLGKGSLCNLSDGGEGPGGATRSLELRNRISNSMKGLVRSKETRDKISKYRMNNPLSQETRSKMSKARTGKTLSQATKDKISVKIKKAWENMKAF